jgi:hypothetical protein
MHRGPKGMAQNFALKRAGRQGMDGNGPVSASRN